MENGDLWVRNKRPGVKPSPRMLHSSPVEEKKLGFPFSENGPSAIQGEGATSPFSDLREWEEGGVTTPIVHSLTHQSHHKYHPNTRYIFDNSSLCQVENALQSFHRTMIWWNDIDVGRIRKLLMTGFKLINMLQDWNG
jgi:hypothetical protein